MAFSPEELEIIKVGKESGKSRDEIMGALTKFRTGYIPPQVAQEVTTPEKPQEEGFVSGVASDFSKRVDSAAEAQVSAFEGKQSDQSAALQTIGQGAGFVGDIVTRGLGAITPDFVKNALKGGIEKIAGTEKAQQVAQKYEQWKGEHPEAAANLEAVGNLSQIIPVGGIGAKGIQMGTDAALIGAGKAISGTAEALGGVGKVIKGAGSLAYKSAITPNVKEAEKLLAYRAKTPFITRSLDADGGPLTRGQTALERGLVGTEGMIGVQAKREADKLWAKEIAPAVANSNAVMTKDELFTPALERIATIEDPTRKKAMQDAYDALIEDYADYPESFDLTKAQALKRDLATFTPQKIFKGKDVASELRTLQADMAGAVRQKTYDSLSDINIKKMYLDWANLDELQQIGVKAISEAQFKGGSGTLIGGLWDMATVPAKTIGGQVLYRVGDMLEFEAPKGIKTFGEYLQSKGYAKPQSFDLPESEAGLGMSIKSSVTPELVANKIDRIDRNLIAKFLDNPDAYEFDDNVVRLFKNIGINNADNETKTRFLKEVMDISGL